MKRLFNPDHSELRLQEGEQLYVIPSGSSIVVENDVAEVFQHRYAVLEVVDEPEAPVPEELPKVAKKGRPKKEKL